MRRSRNRAPARHLLIAAASALALTLPSLSAAHGPTHHAIEDLSARIEAGGTSANDFLRRGELYRIERKWDAAERDYDRAAQLAPGLREVAVARAALYLDRGRPDRAKAAIDRLLSDHPDHSEALRVRAMASVALGWPLEAAQDLDRRIELVPHPTPDHYIERARLLAGCGEQLLGRAVRGLDEGIVRLGPIVSLEFCAIELEMQQGLFDSALRRLEDVAPQFDRKETLLERRGEILTAAGRVAEAREAFAAALAAIESGPPERRGGRAAREMEARLRAALGAEP
ncbi:MAG TPA: tetratricopeptide repeat protein [Candidatus Eisenbacteria bacterium]|nr:tetratricopeptide repeat protein [Candidatus Eisenbacteria bacterium]